MGHNDIGHNYIGRGIRRGIRLQTRACTCPSVHSYGLYNYGLYSHGLHSHGLYSCCPSSLCRGRCRAPRRRPCVSTCSQTCAGARAHAYARRHACRQFAGNDVVLCWKGLLLALVGRKKKVLHPELFFLRDVRRRGVLRMLRPV